jgi:DNA gyrase/topoisomerase IV subunit A
MGRENNEGEMWVTQREIDGLRERIARMESEIENHERYLDQRQDELNKERATFAEHRRTLALLKADFEGNLAQLRRQGRE